MLNFFTLFTTKLFSRLIRFLGLGSGSTWPGEVALAVNGKFISQIINRNPQLKIVCVTGTNGKTTTTKIISHVLADLDHGVIHNQTGANLLNGVASSLINASNLDGKTNCDVLVLEVDENSLPLLLGEIQPDAIVLLNLFRDQLDRYGEINAISAKWQKAFADLTIKTKIIINGNDPELVNLGSQLAEDSVFYFGLNQSLMSVKKLGREADQIICPRCSHRLIFDAIAYSHIGAFHCPHCQLASEKIFSLPADFHFHLFGLFNRYNLTAAALVLEKVWQLGLDEIKKSLSTFNSAFGRQELILVKNKKVLLQLAKNPSRFNQALSILNELGDEPKNVVIVLNNKIPDGRDVSWIWDVDFQPLLEQTKTIFIAGDRAFDMAVRLKYQLGRNIEFARDNDFLTAEHLVIGQDLSTLLNRAIDETADNDWLVVFPTYSAMLEVRSLLTGESLDG